MLASVSPDTDVRGIAGAADRNTRGVRIEPLRARLIVVVVIFVVVAAGGGAGGNNRFRALFLAAAARRQRGDALSQRLQLADAGRIDDHADYAGLTDCLQQ